MFEMDDHIVNGFDHVEVDTWDKQLLPLKLAHTLHRLSLLAL